MSIPTKPPESYPVPWYRKSPPGDYDDLSMQGEVIRIFECAGDTFVAEIDCNNDMLAEYLVTAANRYPALVELTQSARCPNTSCEDGLISEGPDPDGLWHVVQCQWCDERDRVLNRKEERL